MKFEDLCIQIFADGADIQEMKKEYAKGYVKGFTTNPTLMKKAGVKNYVAFAKEAVREIPDLPLSLEVFSDEFEIMYKEAKVISSLGKNVYVKIPITNSKGDSSIPLIGELSKEGIKLNVTAMLTAKQAREAAEVLADGTKNILSIFAGRIMDTGRNAEQIMRETGDICRTKPGTQCLWASCREVYNIIQAQQYGVDIITVTNDILKKLPLLGKDLEELSLETVQMFTRDSKSLGYSILG